MINWIIATFAILTIIAIYFLCKVIAALVESQNAEDADRDSGD